MANVTDPLIRNVQGSDPQNLMEYITRQKIYDSRYWKEDCFGLTVADVLEKAASSLTCVGGTFGPNQQPTKFVSLTLKLLQLQPDVEVMREDFVAQEHFKYARALGAMYLRLTARPADIYQQLEPLYKNYSKLKVRGSTSWDLQYMDTFVHELLTEPRVCGIALPRLPVRETLEQEGYLEEGPRESALKEAILKAGGMEEYLTYKRTVQKSPAALRLWKKRTGQNGSDDDDDNDSKIVNTAPPGKTTSMEEGEEEEVLGTLDAAKSSSTNKRSKTDAESDSDDPPKKKKKKKKDKDKGYGSLFKTNKKDDGTKGTQKSKSKKSSSNAAAAPAEGSAEYWNAERAKLGLAPLRQT